MNLGSDPPQELAHSQELCRPPSRLSSETVQEAGLFLTALDTESGAIRAYTLGGRPITLPAFDSGPEAPRATALGHKGLTRPLASQASPLALCGPQQMPSSLPAQRCTAVLFFKFVMVCIFEISPYSLLLLLSEAGQPFHRKPELGCGHSAGGATTPAELPVFITVPSDHPPFHKPQPAARRAV